MASRHAFTRHDLPVCRLLPLIRVDITLPQRRMLRRRGYCYIRFRRFSICHADALFSP